MTTTNSEAILDTYTNWMYPQERTIFGEKEGDLFYNYSDRLPEWDSKKTDRAEEYAALVATPKTAKYFEAMLSYFHDGAIVSLRHIVAGANPATGYPYLIFGYKYDSRPGDIRRLAKYDKIRKEATAAKTETQNTSAR